MLDKILKIGHPDLYRQCESVRREELDGLEPATEMMSGCILAFRKKYGSGRAIAAPQVSILKRIIVLNIDHPFAIFNPEIYDLSEEMMEKLDEAYLSLLSGTSRKA